jgi:hypothetical protein
VSGTGISTDTIDFNISGTLISQLGSQYFSLPKGSTAERPVTPSTGMFRYNTTNNSLEVYGSAAWEPAGSLRWEIVTSDDSIEKGEAFVVDTSVSQINITLPSSPSLGDSVRIMDLAGTFSTNNCVVIRNGSNIMGLNQNLTLSTNNASIGLVYINSTVGWKLIEVI